VPCEGCDRAACESSGYCSDAYLFEPYGVTEACVFPLVFSQAETGSYYLQSCYYSDEVMTNLGCVDYYYPNASICELDGGMWITQATNEAECAAYGKKMFP
jgi:hypothetical protein